MLDDHVDHESGHTEREIPHCTVLTGDEGLDPCPPPGWVAVTAYDSRFPPGPLEIATWFGALNHAQDWSRQTYGKRRYGRSHMVSRDQRGRRVLSVHPDWKCEAVDLIDSFDGAIRHCNCGGSDCLFADIQVAGARTFAKRAWAQVSTEARFQLADEYEANNGTPLPLDLLGHGEDLDGIDDAFLLNSITEASAPYRSHAFDRVMEVTPDAVEQQALAALVAARARLDARLADERLAA